jgi:hypothetical protein
MAENTIMDEDGGQEEYIRQVLEAYRKTPGTMGRVRRADRMLAAQLYQRGLSVKVIENALVLAATCRLIRPADAPPLGKIRSLAYFLPVIEEVWELPVSEHGNQHVRRMTVDRASGSAGPRSGPRDRKDDPGETRAAASLWTARPVADGTVL